jgi:TRAP-type C4-dicarboxylate transport system permease large subunit
VFCPDARRRAPDGEWHLYACSGTFRRKAADLPSLGSGFRKTLPVLMLPIIIIFCGDFFGFTTPTRSTGIPLLAALIISTEIGASYLNIILATFSFFMV